MSQRSRDLVLTFGDHFAIICVPPHLRRFARLQRDLILTFAIILQSFLTLYLGGRWLARIVGTPILVL